MRSPLLLMLLILTLPSCALAIDKSEPITLYVGQAHVIDERDVRRIAVGNGKVIQAAALDDRQILILPEAPGQSSLILWGKSGPQRTYSFNVLAADTARLLTEVRAFLGPLPKVSVRAVGEKILIEGSEMTEEQSSRVSEVARRYPQVVNLVPRLGMERMIGMDVKFIEIRREMLEDLGVKWNGSSQGPSFQVIGDAFRGQALRPGGAAQGSGLEVRPRIWPPAGSLSLATALTSKLNFLVQTGDAAILAEPRLSCRSGGNARFVAGGELPIPVSGALGTASVAFKEYGIKFEVNPTVSETGVIAARISTEISAINFEVSVKDVPGLTKRRAETDVNLREHETLVIAGLLTDEGSRNMDRVAGASELPVLGGLFRSRQFRDRQTELVVLITPRFVSAEAAQSTERVGMAPMREPTRVLPPLPLMVPESAQSDDPYLQPGRSPQSGSPVPGATGSSTPTDVVIRSAGQEHSSTPSSAVVPLQEESTEVPQDRGTIRRYKASRERLRMVE